MRLGDPTYNIPRHIDLRLDVYSSIIMNYLIRKPGHNIIAHQTQLGRIPSGKVNTFNFHVVINNLEDILNLESTKI